MAVLFDCALPPDKLPEYVGANHLYVVPKGTIAAEPLLGVTLKV
jgi:hypothetical protein